MSWDVLLFVILMGFALSADAFAVSITYGLVYTDLNKKRTLFIALVFGIMQGLMPLIGFWLVELIQYIVTQSVGSAAGIEEGIKAGEILSTFVAWVAFFALLFVGGKMLIEAIMDLKKPAEEKEPKKFSIKETLMYGVITAIDALATGVALHNVSFDEVTQSYIYSYSTTSTIFLHVVIIAVITFVISLIGLTCGRFFEKLLKGKYEVASIIGGVILICLGIWVVVDHYI